jgi:ethanolamine-phosphate phospho-lyase
VYRGKYRQENHSSEEEISRLYAEEVRALCKQAREEGRTVAAFIAESLQSCGGQILPPENYLRMVYK